MNLYKKSLIFESKNHFISIKLVSLIIVAYIISKQKIGSYKITISYLLSPSFDAVISAYVNFQKC